MNWEEFLTAYKEIVGDSVPPLLMMRGVAFDNQTSYMLEEKWNVVSIDANNETVFGGNFGLQTHEGDFIFIHPNRIKIGSHFYTGGHPGLCGGETPNCAGRIMEGYFFFDSGHFHPKEDDAVFFMFQFILNSCEGLGGVERDAGVLELCEMKLRIYEENSETATYDTTLLEIIRSRLRGSAHSVASSPPAAGGLISVRKNSMDSVAIKRSAPMVIGTGRRGGGRERKPTLVRSESFDRLPEEKPSPMPRRKNSHADMMKATGMSSAGRHLSSVKVRSRPVWMPNSEVSACGGCGKEFTFARRKHHCRQCGGIFCNTCSNKKKVVKFPATKKNDGGGEESNKEVRVCNGCYAMASLH